MKKLLTALFLVLAFTIQAQEKTDSVSYEVNTTIDSLNALQVNKINDIKAALKAKQDSLGASIGGLKKINSLKSLSVAKLNGLNETLRNRKDSLNLSTGTFSKLDSAKQKLENKTDSIENRLRNPLQNFNPLQSSDLDSKKSMLTNKMDSLKNIDPDLLNLDSAQIAVQSKIDSLKSLDLPHEKYTRKLDSLQSTYTEKANAKIASLQEKANRKLSDVKNKIAGNLNVGKDINIDIPEVQGLDIPNTNLDLPDVNTDLSLPDQKNLGLPTKDLSIDQSNLNADIDLDATSNIDTNLGIKDKTDTDVVGTIKDKANVSEYTEKLDDLKKAPKEKIDKLKEVDELKGVTDKVGKIKELSSEVESYQEELAKVKEGDLQGLEEKAESYAENIEGVKELQNERAEFDKIKADHEEYKKQLEEYQDVEFVKQKATEKVTEMAIEHFAEHQGVLKSAQAKLLAYKGKYTSLPSIKDIPKRMPNPYAGKSLKERIAPGFQIEVQRSDYTGLDLAPFVGYKFNKYLTVYAGYLYRFTFDNDKRSFLFEEGTKAYGPRVFANYKVYKGFFATVGFDHIRTSIPRASTTQETSLQWVNSAYVGVGKQYRFAKKINGSIQGVFNLLHDENSPYNKKFNLRMGFELEWKKKAKSRRKAIIKK